MTDPSENASEMRKDGPGTRNENRTKPGSRAMPEFSYANLDPSETPDGWSKSGASKIAKMILGPFARVRLTDGRCIMYLEGRGGVSNVLLGSSDTWEGLIRQVFVEPLRARENVE